MKRRQFLKTASCASVASILGDLVLATQSSDVGRARRGFQRRNGIEYDTKMKLRVVLDTNVLVTAIRSRNGASFQVLSSLVADRFDIVVSTPLILEYEAALLRHSPATAFSPEDVGTLVDSICSIAQHQEIFYLWRPILRDPRDDMVLEVAVAAACDAIVTFNRRDFRGADRFGLAVLAPAELLQQLGGNE